MGFSWVSLSTLIQTSELILCSTIHVKTSTPGNKGRRPKRQRSSRAKQVRPSVAIVENSGDRSKSRQYKLKWFKDTKAFKYSGYESAIRIPGEIPEPPNGVKASTNDYRSFMKDGKLQVHFGPTHYHLLCIVAKRRILIHRPILPSHPDRSEIQFGRNFDFYVQGPVSRKSR